MWRSGWEGRRLLLMPLLLLEVALADGGLLVELPLLEAPPPPPALLVLVSTLRIR